MGSESPCVGPPHITGHHSPWTAFTPPRSTSKCTCPWVPFHLCPLPTLSGKFALSNFPWPKPTRPISLTRQNAQGILFSTFRPPPAKLACGPNKPFWLGLSLGGGSGVIRGDEPVWFGFDNFFTRQMLERRLFFSLIERAERGVRTCSLKGPVLPPNFRKVSPLGSCFFESSLF